MSAERFGRFFREADTDGSGQLDFAELSAMLKKRGYRGTDSQLRGMFLSVDTSGDNLISLDEYLEAMGVQPPSVHGQASMRYVFRSFDVDGNGVIDKKELKAVFAEMGKHFSEDEINRMMELVDTDGSGTLDYEEFIEKVFHS
ncbi:hypothetical protein CAPTEDRAFT_227092 [Capitella teleta]|uniref:EF-hand domain-containing protein n=1 Tax=Capitella teleta TaxID=283909 RepID=R7UBC0_CAPTE|nr:hypothetical protein CAPTEDRAFT_227092 [Capitella teleta]|eukprot:ELU00552.1 hypothetical protein CAPTEDRAFT_227092 [Capitella teleta]